MGEFLLSVRGIGSAVQIVLSKDDWIDTKIYTRHDSA